MAGVSERLADLLARRGLLVGTVLTLPGATAAELLAEPFDVVWIDLEHGALGPLDAQEMILGAQSAGTYAMARLPADAYKLMSTMLDAGADGVVLADVTSARVARDALDKAAHPPDGSRGWGPRRLSSRGRCADRPTPSPSIWVQIESENGVNAISEIVSMPGVAAAVVGTADLSFAVGQPLDVNSPELLAAIELVRSACVKADVPLGIAGALDAAPLAALAGASILVHSTDARLSAKAVDGAAEWMRRTLNTDLQEASG